MLPTQNSNGQKNEQLTRELMTNTLVNEVTRVMLSSRTLKDAINSYFLGITEISGLNKIVLFEIDSEDFCLKPMESMELEKPELQKLDLPLDFMSGDYPDSIFLNKQIIVENADKADPFFNLTSSYVVMPIVSRITSKCWEVRNCGHTECPVYEGHNPYCWSVQGAALDLDAETEDEKRKQCVKCSQFKCRAVLWIDTKAADGEISADAIGHLTTLNRHMGMVMETFDMYSKLEKANNRLEESNEVLTSLNNELNVTHQKINRELDHARSIQKGLLPSRFPGEYLQDVAARYIPAGKVGGDYYDCFAIDKDTVGIVMADVSGHGIAAALIMSMFKVLLKTFSPTLKEPKTILEKINDTFLREIKSTNYVTVFYGTYNQKSREFRYCNAGHTPQILMQGESKFEELKASGLFVGVLDDIMLVENSMVLEEPARLILYTDGITESKNEEGRMYEFENLKKQMESTRELSCIESLEALMAHFADFKQSAEILDDITLLICNL